MKILNILLFVVALGLSYLLFQSLYQPVKFNTEKVKREELVKNKMKYIRELQLAHNSIHERFASTFDSLKLFVENDSFTVVKMVGDPDQLETKVSYETFKEAVADSLLTDKYDLSKLSFIPGVKGEHFRMETGTITKGKFDVPVMELEATYPQVLKGLDKDYIDASKSFKIGSMYDPVYNANWEGK